MHQMFEIFPAPDNGGQSPGQHALGGARRSVQKNVLSGQHGQHGHFDHIIPIHEIVGNAVHDMTNTIGQANGMGRLSGSIRGNRSIL